MTFTIADTEISGSGFIFCKINNQRLDFKDSKPIS